MWIINYTHCFVRNVFFLAVPSLSGVLIKPPLKLKHRWVIAFLRLMWISWWSNGNIFHVTSHLCGFPTQGQVTRSFDVFLISAWINGWVNNREAGDLRRHRAHHDVILMCRLMGGGVLACGVYACSCRYLNVFKCLNGTDVHYNTLDTIGLLHWHINYTA